MTKPNIRTRIGVGLTALLAILAAAGILANHTSSMARAPVLVLTGVMVGLMPGAVLAFLVGSINSRKISKMVERVRDLTEDEANRSRPTVVSSRDGITELATGLQVLSDKMHHTLPQVSAITDEIASTNKEISASSSDQIGSIEIQKDQTAQVATAMQQMASTVLQISENSNNAANASRKAAETARTGGKVVDETLANMRAIAASVGETAKKVEELGKHSDQIGQIIGVIDDIADQTNLLALNAAIEAARAGEQGRGFAVVADEVRKLADRTSTATKEIARMITTIQSETKNVVAAMEAGSRQVEQGLESTSKAGQSLNAIIQMSEGVGDMITHIATAATEQSTTTEHINNSIEQITKITVATAAASQQTTAAFEHLSGLAHKMQSLLSQFQLAGGP
jgi:methyl-accepting chemotaxis protein